jgi:TIGR00255 family protein
MKSMTGFGRAVINADNFDASIDISSVNRKGLEATVNLPRDWQAMERVISAKVKERFSRGKVLVSIKVNFKTCESAFSLNEAQLANSLAALKGACANLGVEFIANSQTLLHVNSLLPRENSAQPDWEEYWTQMEAPFESALDAIDAMRTTEGDSIKADFLARLDLLVGYLAEIKTLSKETPRNYMEQLMQRLRNLKLELDMQDERVLKEVALYCDKIDVSEETTRLGSHIDQFKSVVNSSENNGRKMDFICQEISREINTIGSKSNNFEISKIVINFKNELERIREQAQNVE